MKDNTTPSPLPKNRTSLYDMTTGHSLLYSHLIGDTSTPSQSKRFYDEVCRYFKEEEEGKRDLYEEIELLFSRRRSTLRTSNQTTRP